VRRSNERATGRIIAAGWDGADDEDMPYDGGRRGTAPHGVASRAHATGLVAAPEDEASAPDGARSAASTPAPASEGRARMPARRRRWWLIGGIAALLVLVLVLPSVLVGQRSPETEARSFLQAILDADTDAVREHMAPPEDGALDVALTDQVLLAATDRVDRYTIEETVVDGDRAEVTATLRLGERTEKATLHLRRQRTGLLHRPVWELDPVVLPVLRAALPVSASSVLVNGIEVELPDEVVGRQAFGLVELHLVALPGVYQLSAPEGGEAVTASPVRSSIPPVLGAWVNTLVELGYGLTDVGEEQLSDALLDIVLSECAQSTGPRPEQCPFGAPEDVTEEGTWEILAPPEILIGGGPSGYYMADGAGGIAEFTVPTEDGDAAVHRVPIEGSAMGMMDKDGRLHGTWFGNQDQISF
jgi:hypothetical protein